MVVAMNDSTSVHSCSTRQNWNTPLLYCTRETLVCYMHFLELLSTVNSWYNGVHCHSLSCICSGPTSSALHQSRECEIRKDDCPHYCYHSHIRTIQTMQVCSVYYSLVSNLCVPSCQTWKSSGNKSFYSVCKVERIYIFSVKVFGTASMFLREWVGWLVSPCSFSVLPLVLPRIYNSI